MSAFTTVLKKEILDSSRERRAMLSGLVFGPLFGPVMFATIMAFTVERSVDEGEEPIDVPVLNASYAPNLVAHLEQRLIHVDGSAFETREALRESVRRGRTDVGLVIDPGFGEALATGDAARVWLVSDGSNNATRSAVARVSSALRTYGRTIGALRLQMRGIDPTIASPLAVLDDDVSTPAGRSILLLGMMTYFLLFACLMGGMHLAIDATAGERERGSLEPLLTLPVTRAALVLGKLLATSAFMAASLAIAVVAFAVAIMFLPLSTIGMTAHFGPTECFSIFVIMLPFVVLGAGLMSVVASFTKTFREAQSYTSIAMLAPTLPIIFAALNPMQPSLTLMLVPSLSQHLLVTSVIKTEPIELAHLGMSMASTLAFGLVLAALAMHRYRSEKLLI